MNTLEQAAVFDWYAATVDTSWDELVSTITSELAVVTRVARGLHGYRLGQDFLRGTDVVAKMIYSEDRAPHVWASGADAPELARVLRARYPHAHYITRADVAYDFIDGEPWDELYQACILTADWTPSGAERARPLKVATLGDWVRKEEGYPGGRTLYVGSMKSPVLARLYEKGKQMRALYPDQLDKYPEGWVRLELQVRPQDDARHELAELDPDAFWGASSWARQLHELVAGSEVARVLMAKWRPGDDDRAWRFLLAQYGPLLRRRLNGTGPDAWADLGRDLGRALG